MSIPTEHQVWYKFEAEKDGKILKLRIEDLSNVHVDNVMNLFMNYYMKEETMLKSTGAYKSNEAKKEYEIIMRNLFKTLSQGSVVCCIDGDLNPVPDIVGASIMDLSRASLNVDNIQHLFQTPEMRKWFKILKGIEPLVDLKKEYEVDNFYDDRGVIVHPNYRKLGISTNFFKVRRIICKEHNVPVTGAWMTSTGSQKAGEKAGWKTMYETSWEDLGHKCDITFENSTEMCKYMIATAD